ncbi:Ribosomal large subunit pseudouridine synthase D [Methyloligella halotolerans]|uniref:Pseudouridine synthase n=1 Tax=Methyloligella halotolerans TaxID=1177755 RepID=A0A1E2RZG9_9HYPH|nr:RluA family pseudouridine synthase [Methyloligella halotolerans]ODA67623.1 Ribosomal large subunit pseudouridine synthase D [Methyloligella halotolerans]
MTEPPKILEAEAEAADENDRLDRFLASRLADLSRTRVQDLIRQGHLIRQDQLSRGGETIRDPKYRVKQGERFALTLPPPEPSGLRAQEIELDIVYEDDQLLVIDKPAGLVVHPGAGNQDGTLVNALLAHCGSELSGIGGVARPGIVHRLDKETSGLLVVAKTDIAHQSLAAQFADHGKTGDMERRYLAVVWGAPPKPAGTVEAPIGRHPTHRTKMAVVKPDRPDAREAVTHYRVLERFVLEDDEKAPFASLVECTLATGRTHQVRLHMAHLGAPLIGDPLYGKGFKSKIRTLPNHLADVAEGLHRQALHAAHLAFIHPTTDEYLAFDSELPADLDKLITAFKEP